MQDSTTELAYYWDERTGNVARFDVFLQNLDRVAGNFNVIFVMDNAPVHNDAQKDQKVHLIKKLPP